MRLGPNAVEELGAVSFVVFVALVGGVVQSIGEFAPKNAAGAIGAFLTLNGVAVVVWWVSVRRRRWSVWNTACQLALASSLAQIISFALVVPRNVPADVHLQSLDVSKMELFTQLSLIPIRFLAAALLVAFGRLLPGSGRGQGGRAAVASREAS